MKTKLKNQFYYKQIIKSIFFIALNFIILSSISCQDRLIVLWDDVSVLVCEESICPDSQTVSLVAQVVCVAVVSEIRHSRFSSISLLLPGGRIVVGAHRASLGSSFARSLDHCRWHSFYQCSGSNAVHYHRFTVLIVCHVV